MTALECRRRKWGQRMLRLKIPVPRGWADSLLEAAITGREDGVAARLRAIGASDEYYDLAIARERGGEGIARSVDGSLVFGWNDAAGQCTLLAAYAHHLVLVRAVVLDLVDADLAQIAASGRFAEARGRLVARGRERFDVLALRAGDPVEMPAQEAPEVWDGLSQRCLCPTCAGLEWDDAWVLTEALTPARLARCVPRTERLARALLTAGGHANALDRASRDLVPRWGPRTLRAALPVARELLSARAVPVRAAAIDVGLTATEDPAIARVALDDAPRIAYAALQAIRHFRDRRPLLPAALALVASTKNGDVARAGLTLLVEGVGELSPTDRARLAEVATRWLGHRSAGGTASEAVKHAGP